MPPICHPFLVHCANLACLPCVSKCFLTATCNNKQPASCAFGSTTHALLTLSLQAQALLSHKHCCHTGTSTAVTQAQALLSHRHKHCCHLKSAGASTAVTRGLQSRPSTSAPSCTTPTPSMSCNRPGASTPSCAPATCEVQAHHTRPGCN